MAAALIGIGCAVLSALDGWIGLLLWAITAPLVCVAIDCAFRAKAEPRKREPPRTALVFRITRRSASASRRRSEPTRFVWHSDQRSRRRSR
jgi:hypothetical protein